MDLAGSERRARRDQLVAGGQHGHARAARAGDVGQAGRHRDAELGRAQRRAGAQHLLARVHVLAGRAQVLAVHDGGADLHVPVALGRVLDADHGVGAHRDDAAGGDADGLAVAQRALGGPARARLAHHGERAPGGPGDEREPVHGRVGERRHVAGGGDIAGQHAAERVGNRHGLARQRADGAQDDPPRLVDGDHTGMIAYPTLKTPSTPSSSAVAFVRSKLAPFAYGPRSMTGTVIERPP